MPRARASSDPPQAALRLARSLRNLFRAHRQAHLRLRGPGAPLPDARGDRLGHIDFVEIEGSGILIAGWTHADTVTVVEPPGTRAIVIRDIARGDVGRTADGAALKVGFEIRLPHGAAPVMLCFERQEAEATARFYFRLPMIATRRLHAARLWHLVRFGALAVAALPAAAAWIGTRSPAARERLYRKLGLGIQAPPRRISAAQLEPPPAATAAAATTAITIVLPVYNAFDLLRQALDRVERHTDLDWRIILVEDCSTDPAVRPFLRDWCAAPARAGRAVLLENPRNLGFIGSVNRALRHAVDLGRHVVLLNSDALVPQDWASRLLAPILENGRVATVTPMSNDAEILSVPRICARASLKPGEADAIDRHARRLDPARHRAELPTGVGFCMAMNLRFLRRVGLLDESFGRGYGEEVDWCQRVRRAGGIHIGLGTVFVEHRGGESFGSEAKKALIARNNAMISRRYPAYDGEVQDFARTDPLFVTRMALAMALAARVNARQRRAEVPIYLAHAMGGGADLYLEDRLAREAAGGRFAVVVRVGSGQARWLVELVTKDGRWQVGADSFDAVRTLLAPLRRRRIVYSCGVGDGGADELPGLLLSLRQSPRDRIEILFHDYLPLSPSYTLLGADGVYRGAPAPDDADPAHRFTRSDGKVVALPDWRACWTRLIAAADEIVVFSHDSKGIVTAAWPESRGRIRLRPHALRHPVGPVSAGPGDSAVIGVLGNIGFHKGAGVVQTLARRAEARGETLRFVVVGNVAPEYPMPANVTILGSYRLDEIAAIAAREGITSWLIPSIWPETFSYATHEALATGLPVSCFALGAQAEAVRASGNGRILAVTAGPDDILDQIVNTIERVAHVA